MGMIRLVLLDLERGQFFGRDDVLADSINHALVRFPLSKISCALRDSCYFCCGCRKNISGDRPKIILSQLKTFLFISTAATSIVFSATRVPTYSVVNN